MVQFGHQKTPRCVNSRGDGRSTMEVPDMTEYSVGEQECRLCAQVLPLEQFGRDASYANGRKSKCNACAAEDGRRRYHSDARKRAVQLACSVAYRVKRKFPAAETGLSSAAYADALLAARECFYCQLPNDGVQPFNLDHRVALGNGGLHSLENLVPCCEPCNRAKRDMGEGLFVAWLQGVAVRLGRAV